jgi:AcrR family transcriptional regulator/DNA-binding MarR family transcriptional regulator
MPPAGAHAASGYVAARAAGDEGMLQLQRARLVAAMVEVVGERGIAGAAVAQVVARSGVSRRTFYDLFDDREDCFLAAFDLVVERAAARAVPAYADGRGWLGRVRGGLRALLEFLDDEPRLGRLAIVEALAAGPTALQRRAKVVERLADVVDEGRTQARAAGPLTRLTAEGVVGATLAVLHARLIEPDPAPTIDLLGGLMALIALPYQGRAAASREAAQPVPARRRRDGARDLAFAGNPWRELDMRLTYRTVRVLSAIAAAPGMSNRGVAEAAEVLDQGQISKLLARLEHLGLIANAGEGHARGEPNAWRLTAKGRGVEQTISNQVERAIA